MMNTKSTQLFAAAFLLAAFLFTGSMSAQTQNKLDISVMKDCCMMKDGKMMQLKDGHLMPLRKKLVLQNGTKIKRNGVCVMPDKTRVRMKEGNCIDNLGTIGDCATMEKPRNGVANG